MASMPPPTAFTVAMLAPWKEETNNRPAYILYLPRELIDKIFSNLSRVDHKSLRVSCAKFEEILNPIVFQRIHTSKARKDRMTLWNLTASAKIKAHVKELVWYELAEDESIFLENAHDRMGRFPHDGLRNAINHDNTHTLPDLASMASTLFWLPSTPKNDDPHRGMINTAHEQILTQWFAIYVPVLESMPELDTFTSRPMPAHHVLSWPSSQYEFVAQLFQVGDRSDIQGYQRNDGLFSVLLPLMIRLWGKIKHLHWADESWGRSSSIMRLSYRNRLAFRSLQSLDLCLCLPSRPFISFDWNSPFYNDRVTCWDILGECIHRARNLSDISMCFEMTNPQVGIWELFCALEDSICNEKVRLPSLTSLTLRDGYGKRFIPLDILLGKFLVRYGPQLRHLSFRRWSVSTSMLYRLGLSRQMQLESFKIDNSDFERGDTVRESDLVGFVNGESRGWPLPCSHRHVMSTTGTKDGSKEDAPICDWANPKLADIPDGMDFCAVLGGKAEPSGGDGDDEDEDYQPSESTDTSESDSDFDLDSDFGGNDGDDNSQEN